MAKKKIDSSRVAAQNRKARFNYTVIEDVEAGIVLTGTEVKSVREGKASIAEAYAEAADYGDGEALYLLNAHIPEYGKAGKHLNHNPNRPRKLLLKKREMLRLAGKVAEKGLTLIPLDIHWNSRGMAKVKLGLCKGKTSIDKRQTIKDREWDREQARTLREG